MGSDEVQGQTEARVSYCLTTAELHPHEAPVQLPDLEDAPPCDRGGSGVRSGDRRFFVQRRGPAWEAVVSPLSSPPFPTSLIYVFPFFIHFFIARPQTFPLFLAALFTSPVAEYFLRRGNPEVKSAGESVSAPGASAITERWTLTRGKEGWRRTADELTGS
ncbi:unnamed protein product [Pleuronectes platessa]|uniref:Uncharacterized protein n=1 Tax=Pleuronectes platessa TaxID=8262 RepID=A0A9N7YRF9_PLEPL|nr:unnamed protein product [Pleuronectes platessa]